MGSGDVKRGDIANYVEVIYYDDNTYGTFFYRKKETAIEWRDEDRERSNVRAVEVYELVKDK